MTNTPKTQKPKDLTPEFERAVKKLLETKPMPRKNPKKQKLAVKKG